MKLYLVRHGQSEGNLKQVYCGVNDVPLTDLGSLQAKNTAKLFDGISVSKIYSSPLKRAYDTAKEISNALNIEIEVDELLQEINFGIFENLSWNNITTMYPDEAKKWIEVGIRYKFVDGESLEEVVERVRKFLNKISDNSVIVTHTGIIQSFLIALNLTSYEGIWDYKINNCDVICIDNDKITYLNINQ